MSDPAGGRRPGPAVRVRHLAVRDGAARRRDDVVAAEEPLEIRVKLREGERSLAVTMRTPGNDFELAVGFLCTEGVLRSKDDVDRVQYCVGGPQEQQFNIVTVALRGTARFDPERLARNFYTTSSCGVCGKASLEALEIQECPMIPPGPQVDEAVLAALPERLRARQRVFERTGGLHAAGLFDAAGETLLVREDVGRHNAVDKVVGALLLEGALPASDRVLAVSGRASFEIMQKALMAGIPVVAAVGAPSSLAVAVAERFGMTLAGFVRADGFNCYAGESRIRLAASRSDGVSTSSSVSGGAT